LTGRHTGSNSMTSADRSKAVVPDLAEYQFATLRKDGEFALYRGMAHNTSPPVLVLSPIAEQPTPTTLARLEHECSLRDELDPEWSAQPLNLARHDGQLALVLADPGGGPMDGLLGQPLEMRRCLRLAVGLAAALRQVHRRGLIHKDVKPGNVLVDAAGNVRLTGFGIASRLPRERQAPEPPEVIAGTLAYMAPEQTGRMNRSIDTRSDLYSFGITLYEMLTGALPFAASDPMEWFHCHIARQATSPAERVRGLPEPVCAIVLKLLAKTAEERYQTAAGVEIDLQKCLQEWDAMGHIDPFPLGAHDASDRLLIPEKLYGREVEINLLLDAFDQVVRAGTPRLVLVSGYSGIGKSSVVNELHKALVPPRGLFASGKFDQFKRDIPYATVAQAFRKLIVQILTKSDADLVPWRDSMLDALGSNGQLIANLVPELELIIGRQPPLADIPPQEAQARFQTVFRRFLGVFARPEHPLALFFDDLQWLDAATLQLLEYLVTEPEVRHVMLVGAYRDNEVGPSHPLTRTLDAIRDAGTKVKRIALGPLALTDVTGLVADSLHCERDRAKPLGQLVYEKTGGNPFFGIQFFATLAEEALLEFDPGTNAWVWDLARIKAKGFTDNVVDLMAGKLDRLPGRTRAVLKEFACLGNSAETSTLALVHGESEEALHAALWEAVRAGLVFRWDGRYAFLHDRVQEAAYRLLPAEERTEVHVRIGRILASRTPPAELQDKIFDIVNQFNRGTTSIRSHQEREQVANLNLLAGRRAKASAAYASALMYLAAGRALLADDCWELQYRLTFDLELLQGECEFLIGELAAAESRLSILGEHAADPIDMAAVTRACLALHYISGRYDRVVEVALDYLRHVGIEFPPHPTKEDVREELDRMWQLLDGRSIDQLLELPILTSPAWRATMNVLCELIPTIGSVAPCMLELVILRMVNISLEHGNSDASCNAYSLMAMVLGFHFDDYQAAFRFGQLSCDLVDKLSLDPVEKHNSERFRARSLMLFGAVTMPWAKPLSACRVLLRRGQEASLESGDLPTTVNVAAHVITNLIASGEPLAEVQREIDATLEYCRKTRYGIGIDRIRGQLVLVRLLRGLTPSFASFDNPEFDERQFEQHLEHDRRLVFAACWYWTRKLQARFFAEEIAAAVEAASKARELQWCRPSFFEEAEYRFFGALALAACCDTATVDELPAQLEAITAQHKKIMIWAESCPENFGNRAALVAAEIARLERRELEAERYYEQAIRLSREQGFIHNEALAHELAGRFHMARGLETIAYAYLRGARYCYERWGALGKVRQLERRYPRLLDERATAAATDTAIKDLGQLDLYPVVKMSQAVSSEIFLDKLVEKLMVLAVEHAGATRGLLIVSRNEEQRIEATAATGPDGVTVHISRLAVSPLDLPLSVLRYVTRARDGVIVDDATIPNQFEIDEYIRVNHAKSILCLPLVKQAKLIGILYLENNLTPYAFTARRVEVLKLLASQAAISLENAWLLASQANLMHAARLTTMGELVASIAHEVNQPLMAIVTNAETCVQWLAATPPDLDEARKAAERVVRNGHRAGEVIKSVRALVGKSSRETTRLDLNSLIANTLELMGAELRRHDVVLNTEFLTSLEPVVGDRVQLEQVIVNLVTNGIEAMSAITHRPRLLRVGTQLDDDGNALIAVEDSGVGIELSRVERIFDPLFSTKPEGMGMGLAICRSIVEAHGGRLWASPQLPYGSIFRFTLSSAKREFRSETASQ